MSLRSASASVAARSASAVRTVSIERPIAPDAQNSYTIASETMPGEMYVLVARRAMPAIRSGGPTR